MSGRSLAILGVTGSIGESSLNIVRRDPGQFHLRAIQCHQNTSRVREILAEFTVDRVLFTGPGPDAGELAALERDFPNTEILWSAREEEREACLTEILSDPGVERVIHGIVGIAGLSATLTCLRHHKDLAIANKESLVVAGPLLKEELAAYRGTLIPVDSEHNALFQLLENRRGEIEKLYLTSSGGAFRDRPVEELEDVRVEEALKHPTWAMGPKITIDSATMVNKSLEVLEAHYLFDYPLDKIEIIIHPQSIIHGMVETWDGAFLAYMAEPTMEFPIAHALYHPRERRPPIRHSGPRDWARLDFREVDERKYPAVKLAYQAARTGGDAPILFNGANEAAVAAFLDGQIGFMDITRIIKEVLDTEESRPVQSVGDCRASDTRARRRVSEILRRSLADKK